MSASPSSATATAPAGLSQMERLLDAYVAPGKTFADIHRSASWWLPFVLSMLASILFTFALQHKIGFQKVAESVINNNPQVQDRISSMTPAQVQQMESNIAISIRITTYAFPVLMLLFALVCAAVLMASFNFGLGAQARCPCCSKAC
jgi:beta-lactamase regulating signal transducer with metallopeptidase domain